jgi:hypothetical protein
MKIFFLLIAFIILTYQHSFSQEIDTVKLKVIGYSEFRDYYLLRTYDYKNRDIIILVSEKQPIDSTIAFKKMKIGRKYLFIKRIILLNMMPAMPLDKFAIIVKRTVLWRGGDSTKFLPVFSLNTRGLYIKKIKK